MTNEDLADRIMARIERDQAIHKSSIVEEIDLVRDATKRRVVREFFDKVQRTKNQKGGSAELWGFK